MGRLAEEYKKELVSKNKSTFSNFTPDLLYDTVNPVSSMVNRSKQENKEISNLTAPTKTNAKSITPKKNVPVMSSMTPQTKSYNQKFKENIDFRKHAEEKLIERKNWEQGKTNNQLLQPISGLAPMQRYIPGANFGYNARENLWQEQAKYGKPEYVPSDIKRNNQLKRAAMYALDTGEAVATLATAGQGGLLTRAVGSSTKALSNAQKAKTAYQLSGKNMKNVLAAKKLAGLEKNVSNANKALTASKIGNNVVTGSVGFGLPVGVDSVEQIMNNKMTPQEGLKHTGNAALLGGAMGLAAPMVSGAVNKLIPDKTAILSSTINSTKNRMIQSQISQKIAQSEAKGITLSAEMKDRIAQEAEKMLDKELAQKYFPQMMDATFNNLGRDFVKTGIDTQLMANADYGLNVAQGNIKPSMETYKEQQKAFSPFYALGAAPTFMRKVVSPVANKAYNTVGNTIAPAFAGEMANALNIKAKGLAGDYQKIDKTLMDRNTPATDFMTKDNIELLEKLDTLPEEEKQAVLRAIYGDKPAQKEILLDLPKQDKKEKVKTKEEIEAEEFMNDAPSIEVNIPKQEKKAPSIEELQKQAQKDLEEITKQNEDTNIKENTIVSPQEAPISNENVSSGINTPKTKKVSKTEQNTDSDVINKYKEGNNKVTVYKPNEEVVPGGHDIYRNDRETEKVLKDNLKWQEGLTEAERAEIDKPLNEFEPWLKNEYPETGSTMAKKASIESKRFELKGTDKEQAFEDFLNEKLNNNELEDISNKKTQLSNKEYEASSDIINNASKGKTFKDDVNKYYERRFNVAVKKGYKDIPDAMDATKAQKIYDKELEQINKQKGTTRVIDDAISKLNDYARSIENKYGIKINKDIRKSITKAISELRDANEREDVVSAKGIIDHYKLDSKFTPSAKEDIVNFFSNLASVRKNKLEELIGQGKFIEAEKLLNKSEKLLRNDTRNGFDQDRWVFEEVGKDAKPTDLGDGYNTVLYTDSQGRTFELRPKGDTWGIDAAGEGKRVANELIDDFRKRIDEGLSTDNDYNISKFFVEGKSLEQHPKGQIFTTDVSRLLDNLEIVSKEGEHTELRKVLNDIINDGNGKLKIRLASNKDMKGSAGRFNKKHDSIIVNSKRISDVIKTIKHEYRHKKDSTSPIYEKMSELSKFFANKYKEYGNKIFHGQDKFRQNMYNYKLEKIANGERTYLEVYSLVKKQLKDSGYSIGDKIPVSVLKKLDITNQEYRVAKEMNNLYNDYRNTPLEKRAFAEGEGYEIKTKLEEDFKEYRRTNSEKLEEYESRGVQGLSGTGNERTGRRQSDLRLDDSPSYIDNTSSSSNYRNSVKIDLDKIKYSKYISQQDIVNLRNIAKKSEQTLIDLGVLDEQRAINEKKNINSDIYVSQKHNLTKEETQAKEYNPAEYYQNTKSDLWSGHATKGRNSKVTARDAAQNILTHAIDAKFLEKVNDITMSKFSIKLGENKRVPEDYRAINSKLLNNLVARNLSETFLNKFEKGHQAIEEMFPDKEQADFFKSLYDNTQEKDIAVPKKYLSKLLSFNREYSEEMFQRYGMDKGGKLKASTKRVLEISDALVNVFKQAVLSSGAFIMHNREGNVSFLVQDSDNYIDTIKNFGKATKMNKNDVPQRIQETGFAKDLGAGFKTKHTGNRKVDNVLNAIFGDKIEEKSPDRILRYEKNEKGQNVPVYEKLSGVEKLANAVSTVTLNRVYKKIFKASQKANTLFEDYERRVAYLNKVDKLRKDLIENTSLKTITTNELIDIVRNHPELENKVVEAVDDCLGNYRTFNATEKKVFKRILPFYSWWRTLARQTLHMAKDRPQRLALIANEIYKMDKDNDDRKDFQRHAYNTGIKDKRSNKELLVNIGRYALPHLDYYDAGKSINNIVKGKENPSTLVGDTVGSVNPIITKTIEGVRGKKFFGSGDIDSARYNPIKVWRKDKDGNSYTETIGYQDSKTGKNYHNLPKTEKAKYISKQLLSYGVPAISNSNSSLKTESLITGLKNNNWKLDKNFIEPDRMSDTEWFTGWNHDDVVNGIKKYVSNNSSEKVKLLNRLGLSLQPKYELNKRELSEQQKESYKEKSIRQRKRYK